MNKEIFSKNILTTNIQLSSDEFNEGIEESLLDKLKTKVEGKCDSFGYIREGSTKIIKRSVGQIQQGQFNGSCTFKIVYSVDVCNPVEGMIVKCSVTNMNKMGLFCTLAHIDPSPLTLILAKQHHLKNEKFESVQLNDIINVEIIGIKFNYNDNNISCIGRLADGDMTIEEQLENELHEQHEIEMDLEDDEESEEENEQDVNESEPEEDKLDDINGELVSEKAVMAEEKSVLEGLKLVEADNENDLDDLEEDIDLNLAEGVQNLEAVDLSSKRTENNESSEGVVDMEALSGESELDELGEEFEGEQLDLDDLSRKNVIPIYNLEEYENREGKLGKEVFDLDVLVHPKYKSFSRPRKNTRKYVDYLIYVQLNRMMIMFYIQNNVEPKTVRLNKNNTYYSEIKDYLSKMGKSLKVEDTDEISHVL